MNYRIIGDSATDLMHEDAERINIKYVPLIIDVEEKSFLDDDSLDLDEFFEAMAASENPIRSACPSPHQYAEVIEAMASEGAEGVFIITLSRDLSGSYNAALIGAEIFNEKHPDIPVHVFDSKAAGPGQGNVALMLQDFIDEGLKFDEIVDKTEKFIDEQISLFVLESLDNLIKNGRIHKTEGLVVNALHIKPIMRSNNGEIELHKMGRGFNRSIKRLGSDIIEMASDFANHKYLTIVHAMNLPAAESLKAQIQEKTPFHRINIVQAKGITSAYADIGGIVVAF